MDLLWLYVPLFWDFTFFTVAFSICAYALVRFRLKTHLVRVETRSCFGLNTCLRSPKIWLKSSWVLLKKIQWLTLINVEILRPLVKIKPQYDNVVLWHVQMWRYQWFTKTFHHFMLATGLNLPDTKNSNLWFISLDVYHCFTSSWMKISHCWLNS